MKILKYAVGFVIAVFLFLFSAAFLSSNGEPVLVDALVVPPFEVRLGIILVMVFILGGFMGLLTSAISMIKLRTEKARLQRRLQNTSQLISGYSK